MRIAIITSTFPPYRGGMGNVAYAHARELARLGDEVTVFCPTPRGAERLKFDFNVIYLKPVIRYGNAAWVPHLADMLDGFDVVHLHYPFFGGAEAALFWKKNKRTKEQKNKLVVTYHMDTVGRGAIGLFFRLYRRLFLRRILAAADKVFVSTLDYAQAGDLAKFVAQDPEKFVVSNLGVDEKFFSPGHRLETLAVKYNILASDFVLLFVGGLDRAHYFKGLDKLIEAVKTVKDKKIKLLVVGDGDRRPEFEQIVASAGLGERVFFAGGVDDRELPQYYNLADALTFPSVDKSEAYGLVALEAGACGKPVIASSLPGVRYVVQDGRTGALVAPKDVNGLAKAINDMAADPESVKEMGERARERIEAEFTWPVIVGKMRGQYFKL
ncbi:MAG: glycosyltransferase family 4 protein [Patescibacteria group bacterium]|nr:glycosyltransferase family 4 protein [Patescibacteria group bacterium]